MSSRQVPALSWQVAFTHALPAGQSGSAVQAMSTQPEVRACTGPAAWATAGSQRWWPGQLKPSSQGTGSQAFCGLQRKPGPQPVGVHGGPHSEPTPSGLHESLIAWQLWPLQLLLSAHCSRGGTPQPRRSLGPAQ